MKSARTMLMPTGLTALALAVRLVPAWLLMAEVADVAGYHTTGAAVLRGDNVYAAQALFPYLPYSQFLQAWALQLAALTHWRFDFLIKLPSIAGDAAAVPLIYAVARRQGRTTRAASLWALAWALNPVAILISAFHGNLMAVLPGLLVGALLAAEAARGSANRWPLLAISSLLLGLAVALRAFPALLLPMFLALACASWSEATLYTAGSLLAAGLSSLPYLLYARATFVGEFLSYSGVPDFGWVSIVRAAPYLTSGLKLAGFDGPLVELTKPLFLLAYALAVLTLPLFRRSSLGRSLLLAPLLFYALYGGVSAQYLVWALPLAIAVGDWLALPFTLAGVAALLGFYTLYHPDILSGRYGWSLPPGYGVGALYAAGNFAIVLLSAAWCLHIVFAEVQAWRARPDLGWAKALRAGWPARGYAALLAAACLPWLLQLLRVGARALEVARSLPI
jgi:hypothetical protein